MNLEVNKVCAIEYTKPSLYDCMYLKYRPDCDTTFLYHTDMYDAIRWGVPCCPVGAAALRSTVASAAVILAVRGAPSVPPASSWSPSVQSMQTESVRLASLSV